MTTLTLSKDQLKDIEKLVAIDLKECHNTIACLKRVQGNITRRDRPVVPNEDEPGKFHFIDSVGLNENAIPIVIDGEDHYACPMHARWLNEDLPHQLTKEARMSKLLELITPQYDLVAIIEGKTDDALYVNYS